MLLLVRVTEVDLARSSLATKQNLNRPEVSSNHKHQSAKLKLS